MEHLRALAAESLAALPQEERPYARALDADEQELVNTLFEEQWARLEKHVSDPKTVNHSFIADFPPDIRHTTVSRVKRRLDALGLQSKWRYECFHYSQSKLCEDCQEESTELYIKADRWCCTRL